MPTLRLVLGDQLSRSLPSLADAGEVDVILMCEVTGEATYVPHHPKKIAFLFSAMRHFAAELSAAGLHVRYVRLDDEGNTGSLAGEVGRALADTGARRLVVTEPGEYRLRQAFLSWQALFGIAVDIREDDRFLCSIARFSKWAEGRRELRMEYFYREMRRLHGLLIEQDGTPTGGQWNYDHDNRKPAPSDLMIPARIEPPVDGITKEVLALVESRFSGHFGTLHPFRHAVTRTAALADLDHFIAHILPSFGDYQDAMVKGEPFLFHSLLSSCLNAGLLLPLEVCRMAEQAYRTGAAPLNAVEGFIRQIIGWREYVRGIYWLHMPDYGRMNALDAHETLPDFYWTAETRMSCIAEAVRHSRDHAYSHHIQRLMVTGNFALLAGLDVTEVQRWYLAVYSDAYEWVEMPNTLGMALYGDGGIMASKPYAASGKYINRMSNHCRDCAYDPEGSVEADACPFNALYWDFLARNEARLSSNRRMGPIYATWRRFSPERREALRAKAADSLDRMREGRL